MLRIMVRYVSLCCLALTLVGAKALIVQAQTPQKPTDISQATTDEQSEPNELRPLSQEDSLLSLQGAEKLMQEAGEAIGSEKYDIAADKLQQARRIFNQLSNYHLKLATLFAGIDPKIVEAQRSSALKSGQLRDDATYQLALVHRAQNKPELAVPLLIQVIESQNPTSDLGKKSYQQLYELGFVDTPLGAPSSPAAATPPSQK